MHLGKVVINHALVRLDTVGEIVNALILDKNAIKFHIMTSVLP